MVDRIANLLSPGLTLLFALAAIAAAWGSSTYQLSSIAADQKDMAAKVSQLAESLPAALADIKNNRDRIVRLEDWRDRLKR